jgi:hemerythrin-like domain-containing protein
MAEDRRRFLTRTAALSVAGLPLLGGPVLPEGTKADKDKEKKGDEVGAVEDLMREHGVLNRVLLVYEEALRRLGAREDVPPDVFHKTATLVRKFVEDYHERLEEKFIFPELEKRKKLPELTAVLRKQHQAGRVVTDVILRQAAPARFRTAEGRTELIQATRAFIRMYRPHEAREDTVLFPAVHKIVPAKRLDELGEQFEKEEDRLFGDEGFEKTVDQVAGIEKQLGIYDLNLFTPKVTRK